PIDHRVVSVAFTDKAAAAPHGVPRPVAPAPIDLRSAPEAVEAPDDRIRFASVNLFVSGPRAQAQVELRWKGVVRTGTAAGWSTREPTEYVLRPSSAQEASGAKRS